MANTTIVPVSDPPLSDGLIEFPTDQSDSGDDLTFPATDPNALSDNQNLGKASKTWWRWFTNVARAIKVQVTSPITPVSANFFSGGGGGTWTVPVANVITYSNRVIGDTMWLTVKVDSIVGGNIAAVAGTVNFLKIAIPSGPNGRYIVNESVDVPCIIWDNGVYALGTASAFVNDPNIYVLKTNPGDSVSAPHPLAASPVNGTAVSFEIAFQVAQG